MTNDKKIQGGKVLNKVKVMMIVGLVLPIVSLGVPGVSVPEEFEAAVGLLVDSLFVIIPVVAAWFTPESQKKIDKLQNRTL